MSESVYKVIEIIGTSKDSCENAAKNAVEHAAGRYAICVSPKLCTKT